MKKLILATAFGFSLSCAFITSPIQANEALTQINIAVEQRATYLDEQFGVLLTYQERQDLKMILIAEKVVTSEVLAAGKTSQEITIQASQTYQLEDEFQQRRLLIEVDAAINRASGGGIHPPCCK